MVDVTTLKMGRKPVKLQIENSAGCAGEGKQSKGNRRRENDGLKITDNKHYVRKKVSRFESMR